MYWEVLTDEKEDKEYWVDKESQQNKDLAAMRKVVYNNLFRKRGPDLQKFQLPFLSFLQMNFLLFLASFLNIESMNCDIVHEP